jgi:hypothetical protein
MHTDTVSYVDTYRSVRDANATLLWDMSVVKLAGQDRWRFIVTVTSIQLTDGTVINGAQFKIFVRLLYSQQHSMFDARQALISSTAYGASQVEIFPDRASVEESGETSVFFHAYSLPEPGMGWSRAIMTPTTQPGYYKASVM